MLPVPSGLCLSSHLGLLWPDPTDTRQRLSSPEHLLAVPGRGVCLRPPAHCGSGKNKSWNPVPEFAPGGGRNKHAYCITSRTFNCSTNLSSVLPFPTDSFTFWLFYFSAHCRRVWTHWQGRWLAGQDSAVRFCSLLRWEHSAKQPRRFQKSDLWWLFLFINIYKLCFIEVKIKFTIFSS